MNREVTDRLRKIEADLARVAADTRPDHAPDAFELSILSRRIGAQAEMLEKGIAQ